MAQLAKKQRLSGHEQHHRGRVFDITLRQPSGLDDARRNECGVLFLCKPPFSQIVVPTFESSDSLFIAFFFYEITISSQRKIIPIPRYFQIMD